MGENNDKVLKCSAIPETALNPKYNTKWKNWNNVTIKNQDKHGLIELKNNVWHKQKINHQKNI